MAAPFASGTLGDLKASVGRDVIEVVVADPARLDAAGQLLERVTANSPRLLPPGGRRASAPGGRRGRRTRNRDPLPRRGGDSRRRDWRAPARTLDEVFLTLTGDHASTPASTDYAQQTASTDYAQQGSPR